jgi:rhamnulokinase
MGASFLAFDLGAESGRGLRARFSSGVLDLNELCRFPNDPVRQDGSLQWDMPRLWLHLQRLLGSYSMSERPDSIGVDAWGCDYGLIGEGANC